ncbi:hypothetical protein E8E12_001542 [Didymella heteroderae]|uniref:Uncharacterized protein n=1 Tax=Didymella heteroderae TaxID=1769908 RepID=A0A9P4WHB4_9PLEO|nr:hypothetical protein E8E12_001542 [Didymella heteroderae]
MEASNASLTKDGGLGTRTLNVVLHGRLPASIAVVSIALIVFGIAQVSSPTLDPKEPPLIKSRVPVIGHIVGIIQQQATYHKILRLYVVYDPHLCQQVLRKNTASFDPFKQEFAQKVFGLSQATYDKIRLNPSIFKNFTDSIHRSFQTESLVKMNLLWLTNLATKMDPISALNAVIDSDNPGQK